MERNTTATTDATANAASEDTSTFPLLGRVLLWVGDYLGAKGIIYGLFILCACLFLTDFLYHRHTYLAAEEIPGFYAIYGFVMCAALIICAKGLRPFLKRPENYYAPNDVESEDFPDDQLERINHDA